MCVSMLNIFNVVLWLVFGEVIVKAYVGYALQMLGKSCFLKAGSLGVFARIIQLVYPF